MTITDVAPAGLGTDRGAECLERARQAAQVIEAEAAAIERDKTITGTAFRALAEAGLFWILVPEEYGGARLDIVSAFKVVQEITRADGSTGWAFKANSCSMAVAVGFMNRAGAEEMFASPIRPSRPVWWCRPDRRSA